MASGVKKGKAVLLPYQQRWVNDDAPLKIWLASRQIGKSFALSMEAVKLANKAKCNNLILSSSERQSREVMQKVKAHLRVLGAINEAEMTDGSSREEIELYNGSRLISLPASPDTVRGFSGNIFLDEFAFHADSREIWRAMYPAVTRGFKVRISSTPNGRLNMFYDLYHDAGFSRHRTTIQDAVAEGLKVDVEQLRKGIRDPDAWAQEFECEFLDGATALIPFDLINTCEHELASVDQLVKGVKDYRVFIGVDIGRKRDLTVIWVIEQVGDVFWTRAVLEISNETFAAQREQLYNVIDMVGAHRVCIDATGIGAQLAEEAVHRYGSRAEAVTFTPKVKEDMAVTTRRAFEDRRVRIPSDPFIRQDLHSVQRIATSAGNFRYEGERAEGSHADRFWALALALHAGSAPVAMPVSYEALMPRDRFAQRGAW